jgi:hypothetical protein
VDGRELDERERSLLDLQSWVVDAVQHPFPLTADSELARRIDRVIGASARGMGAAERLDVYREQFWLRHLSNLRDDFPTVAWALGPDPFEKLSAEYLREFPPRTWDLHQLGADLPAYAASHAPWRDDALACDAARLDWAFMESHVAPDASPFDPRLLSCARDDAWPSARIGLHPSVRALTLVYPLHDVRRALKEGRGARRPSPQRTRLVVWRDARCSPRDVVIDPFAFALLTELANGAALGEACQRAAGAEGNETNAAAMGERVSACFQEWTAIGWVSAVTFAV